MPQKVRIGSINIDAVGLSDALRIIVHLARSDGGTVFTPNVDHIVRAESDAPFQEAYRRCSLSLCDGTPVLWAAYLLGTPLPRKLSGSFILPQILRVCAAEKLRVFLVGGRREASTYIAASCSMRFPGLQISGYSPPTEALQAAPRVALGEVVAMIARIRPHVVFVSLSSPLQEVWADAAWSQLRHSVFVCTGSAIDILAGLVPPAPPLLATLGFEWAYRLAHEPRRLGARYLLRDPAIFGIITRQKLSSRRGFFRH